MTFLIRFFGGLPPPKIGFVDNSRASAYPAAETISEKGRSRRRSVKNRRLFDPQKCEASDLAKSRDRPRNRFTAAAFRLPFGRAKGNVYLNRFLRLAESCGPQPPPSGGPLFAFAHSRGRSAGRGPNIDVLFVKQALRLRRFAATPSRRTATRPKARAALRRRRTAGCRPNIF